MVGSKFVLGLIGTAAVALSAPAGATLVASFDFDNPAVGAPGVFGGFSGGLIQATNGSGLGGTSGSLYRTDTPATMTLQLSGLGAHDSVTLDFLLAFIDSWDGIDGPYAPDYLDIKLDGTLLATYSAENFIGGVFQLPGLTSARGDLGFNNGWEDSVVHTTFTAAHSASSLLVELNFYGAGAQFADDESFGVDNFVVTMNSAVPEPATWAMMIGGFALAGAAMRRRNTVLRFA